MKWIRQGVPDDLKDTTRVVGVRMVPDKLVLRPGQKHQLQLIADYSDGNKRDVTRLSVFTVNNDRYANVGDEGLVTAADAGETAIVGRFARTFAATSVIVLNPNNTFAATPVPQGNLIDRPVVEKLNRLKIAPSALAGDEEFLRRVYLDLIGVQPKPEEVRAFLTDKEPGKREKEVDVLFRRPEFVDHWSLKWGDLLQNSRNSVSSPSVYQFREFIRGAVASNMPLDEFARRIITSRRRHCRRSGQRLLCHQQGHQRYPGARHSGLLRRPHVVRPLSQSPDGELDTGGLLRSGELLHPGEYAAGRPLSRRREYRVGALESGRWLRDQSPQPAGRSRRSFSAAGSRNCRPAPTAAGLRGLADVVEEPVLRAAW